MPSLTPTQAWRSPTQKAIYRSLGNDSGYERRVRQCGQFDLPDTIGILPHDCPSKFERQTGLADAARPGQCQKSGT
jgi:hypothetical protein